MGFDGIGARTKDSDFEFVELLFCVAKLGRLDDSTGSVGFGEEKKQDALALEVFERDGFVFVRLEAERGSFVAGLEHGSKPRKFSRIRVRAQTHPDLPALCRSYRKSAI